MGMCTEDATFPTSEAYTYLEIMGVGMLNILTVAGGIVVYSLRPHIMLKCCSVELALDYPAWDETAYQKH